MMGQSGCGKFLQEQSCRSSQDILVPVLLVHSRLQARTSSPVPKTEV